MGVINHDAIIATGFNAADVAQARDKALSLGLPCSELVPSPINGYVSFLIAPDGSNEWWPNSDRGDVARAAWATWMREQWNSYSAFVRFVHVRYGEREGEVSTDGSEACIDDKQGMTVEIAESQPNDKSER